MLPAPVLACGQHSDDCRIKGNISRDGKHIYHVPGGAFYESTRLKPAKGECWFCGGREARAAGAEVQAMNSR